MKGTYIHEIYIVNERIKAAELRVISDTGENLGVLPTHKALTLARERELDLVVVAPEIQPPVAKILDFKKYLYDERKKKSAAKSKAKKSELKEVKFGPSVGIGDFNHYITRTKEWLEDGNRVKVSVIMRGREGNFPEFAIEKLNKFADEISELGKPEAPWRRMGNIISQVFIGI